MFSSTARIINSKFCIKISYIKRITGLAIYFFIGYISLFTILFFVEGDKLNHTVAFLLTLIPSLIMGTGSAFGEASILGYLRLFPEGYVSGWSSGTGLAGVSGASITLIVKYKNISSKWLYLAVSPVCLIYFLAFLFSKQLREKAETKNVLEKIHDTKDIDNKGEEENNEEERPTENLGDISDMVKKEDTSENKEMSCVNFGLAFSKSKRFIINLACVYCLEYIILSGLSERVSKKNVIKEDFFHNILYETFCLCYQLGVWCSRSSLVVVKHIKLVEIFTICQAINLALWFTQVLYPFVHISWICFAHLIIVGLFGGSAYVGCFYFVLESKDIDSHLKELSINIGTIFNDCGILTSSLVVLLLDNTLMKI